MDTEFGQLSHELQNLQSRIHISSNELTNANNDVEGKTLNLGLNLGPIGLEIIDELADSLKMLALRCAQVHLLYKSRDSNTLSLLADSYNSNNSYNNLSQTCAVSDVNSGSSSEEAHLCASYDPEARELSLQRAAVQFQNQSRSTIAEAMEIVRRRETLYKYVRTNWTHQYSSIV